MDIAQMQRYLTLRLDCHIKVRSSPATDCQVEGRKLLWKQGLESGSISEPDGYSSRSYLVVVQRIRAGSVLVLRKIYLYLWEMIMTVPGIVFYPAHRHIAAGKKY